ncbi:MAG: TetR-like C-terminal domain-containing protein [Ruminococcus sp.]|nr:TetR-like C-terminal domain-containing protein [Ruminococcus sp.]
MANFTERAIKETFLNLLNEKPVNKITVKDISQTCGINRNTFYYHYNDIPSLMEEIFTEQAELIVNLDENASLYELLIYAADFAIENKTAVYHIYKSANREMFETYLERITEKTISNLIEGKAREYNTSENNKKAIIHYYKCLLVGFVIDWLLSGMQYELQDELKIICDLFDGAMEKALERG